MVGLEDNTKGLMHSYENWYIILMQHLTKLKIFKSLSFD
jgi:hypothetical protein